MRKGFLVLLALAVPLRAEEDAFSQKGGESPGETLRKSTRKMARVEDDLKLWISKARDADPAKTRELSDEAIRRQKEVEDDLARLILKLQKEQDQKSMATPAGGGGSQKQQPKPQPGSPQIRQGKPESPGGSENPQEAGKKDDPKDSRDPATDIYKEQYHHRLIETLKEISPRSKAWGNLPERLRGEIVDGANEEFLPDFEAVTREYYKRIDAESRKESEKK